MVYVTDSRRRPVPVHCDIKRKGQCKWFNTQKGYGFIEPDDESGDVFVHQSVIQAKGFRSLVEGEPVEYYIDLAETSRAKAAKVTGPDGKNVRGNPQGRKINQPGRQKFLTQQQFGYPTQNGQLPQTLHDQQQIAAWQNMVAAAAASKTLPPQQPIPIPYYSQGQPFNGSVVHPHYLNPMQQQFYFQQQIATYQTQQYNIGTVPQPYPLSPTVGQPISSQNPEHVIQAELLRKQTELEENIVQKSTKDRDLFERKTHSSLAN